MSIIENSNEIGTENLKSQSEEAKDENNNNTNVISDNGSVSNQTSENMIENNDQENEKDFKDEEKIVPPFYTYLTNPLMLLLDDNFVRINNIVEDIVENLQVLGDEPNYSNIPLALDGCGTGVKGAIEHIENLIQFENYQIDQSENKKLVPAKLQGVDEISALALIGHSLGAYVSVLESSHLKHLATTIVTDASLWISKLFRYPDSAAHFHEEEKEGVVKICQLAIHKKYPKYCTDGYEALFTKPPVFYISASAKHNLSQHICHQLGLPLSSVRSVACVLGKMDLKVLNTLVQEDLEAGRQPTLIIAYAGTPLLGRCDDMQALHDLCASHDIWLHVEGSALSMLCLPTTPEHLSALKHANSISLNLSAWLCIPSIPFVTLFRSPDLVLTRLVGLSTFNVRYKLNCISLWLALLSLGFYKTIARLHFHTNLASMIYQRLKHIDIRNQLVLFDFESPSVVFKYQIRQDSSNDDTKEASAVSSSCILQATPSSFVARDSYCDTLNIWLTDMLKHVVRDIHVSAVELEGFGMCVRYAPLETSFVNAWNLLDTCQEDLDHFLDSLEQHIHIIDTTVATKPDFFDVVSEQDNVRLMFLPTWAGLGAVQYLPDKTGNPEEMDEESKHELNVLNQQIVQQLKNSDSAFSLGVTEAGWHCIRFGLVTKDTDLEELIAVVMSTGKQIEASSKYLETLADAVKKGIVKAAEDLEKENREKLLQEGLLRQVPIVSSFINWWSPPPKDPIKGRTFNLASGKIASTEKTYQTGIQIIESTDELALRQASSDVAVKFTLKPSKKKRLQSGDSTSADGDGGKSGQQNDATEDAGASSNIANGDLQRDEKEDNKEDEKEDTKKDKQEDKKEDKKEDRETTIVSAVSA